MFVAIAALGLALAASAVLFIQTHRTKAKVTHLVTSIEPPKDHACPVLAANSEAPCSATCVPVAITGRGEAILHLAGPVGHPPDNLGAPDLIARGVGDRLTLLQALATFQLQAARDPLTGLLNRVVEYETAYETTDALR